MKKCSQCKQDKEHIAFYRNTAKRDGLQNACKACTKENDKKKIISGEHKRRCNEYYHRRMKDPIFRFKHNSYQSPYKNDPDSKKQRREYYATHIQERLSCTIRSRIRSALKSKSPKSNKTRQLIGCDINYLKDWLQGRFKKGMTWGNYGEWHIDHIKPCAAFNLTKTEEQKRCFHFTNLQPLWKIENLRKGCSRI